jgi:type I restriction enzyme M protein
MQGMSMDITTLENWLWEAACSIRGPLDAPKYKDYILPLLFYNSFISLSNCSIRARQIHGSWPAGQKQSRPG